MKRGGVYHILTTTVWVFLSDHPSMSGLAVGLVTSFLLLMLFQKPLDCCEYIRRILAGLRFIWYFLILVIESNIRIAIAVMRKDAAMIPGEFITYDIRGLTSFEVLILCQGIGLTPGTIVADVPNSGSGDSIVLHIFASGTPEEVRETLDHELKQRILAFTR